MTKEFDHDYTDEIVCPYCGHEHGDSYEYFSRNDESTNIECDECGKHFRATMQMTTDYSTSLLPCLNNEGDHDWGRWRFLIGNNELRYCRACGKEEQRKVGVE